MEKILNPKPTLELGKIKETLDSYTTENPILKYHPTIIFELLAKRAENPEVLEFIKDNGPKLKELFAYFSKTKLGIYTGDTAYAILKMANLLGVKLDKKRKTELKNYIKNTRSIKTILQKEAENL